MMSALPVRRLISRLGANHGAPECGISQRGISRRGGLAAVLLLLTLGPGMVSETPLAPPSNSFSPADDIVLGLDAAAEVTRHLTTVEDQFVADYLQALGARLVGAIPHSLRQPTFQYSFDVLDVDEIASVALPGGPIFVSRRMIEAVRSEGELAGLLAHQVSHVALRHGTAQATSGERFQVGAIAGRTIGTVAVGGGVGGDIFAVGEHFGVATYFLTYDPAHDRQADLLATRMMANAGFDPWDISNAFRTIENDGGYGAWRWTQSHPDLDTGEDGVSRSEYIAHKAGRLGIGRSTELPGHFDPVQLRLRELPRAPTVEDAAPRRHGGTQAHGVGVVVPSGASRPEMVGDMLQLHVPDNWRRYVASNTVIFAPDGAFVDSLEGPSSFTHGVQVGVARSTTGYLEDDTRTLVQSFARENPALRWPPVYQNTMIGGRAGLTTVVSNVSAVTERFEYVSVSTAHLPDGSLLYVIGIAPDDDASAYRGVYRQLLESIEIVD